MRIVIALLISLFAVTAARAEATLYHDLGEDAGIARITEEFSALMLDDARIAAMFDNTNMKRFKAKFAEQMCALSGGPCTYTGQAMDKVHTDLAITDADFYSTVEHLQEAMRRADVPFRTQNRLLALLAPMSRDVIGN